MVKGRDVRDRRQCAINHFAPHDGTQEAPRSPAWINRIYSKRRLSSPELLLSASSVFSRWEAIRQLNQTSADGGA